MKLALSFLFLIKLQLISGFGWIPYNIYGNQIQSPVGFEYENTGIDQNGNPFYQQEYVQTSFTPLTEIIPELPVKELEFSDYFQQDQPISKIQQVLKPIDKDIYLKSVGNLFNKAWDTQNLILNSPNMIEDPLLSQQRGFDALFSKESATNFNLPTTTFKMPGLGPFHFEEPEPTKHQKDDNKEKRKFEFIMGVDHQIQKPITEQKPVLAQKPAIKKTITQEKPTEEKLSLIKFEKELEAKEKQFLEELKSERSQQLLADDHLYILLDKNVTPIEADDLLHYVSEMAGFPFKWIKNIRIEDHLVIFQVDNVDLTVLCSIIKSHHDLVQEKKGYKILSCSRGNTDIQALKHRLLSNRKNLFIVVVVVCVTVFITLVFLLSLFVIRRKAYLKQKLLENVNTVTKKNKFDDVEKLVPTEKARSNFINKVWPFKTKEVNVQQADLCRSTKLSNSQNSPMNNTQTTDVSGRCDNFESTPIKTVDERKESSRTSSSS
jgi:hypothetical protein